MAAVFDIDGVGGRFAMYDEPPLPAASDAPLTNPLAHLDRIKIHSDLAYLQDAVEFDTLIAHAEVPAASYGWDWSTWSNQWFPTTHIVNHLLGVHNLGYIPAVIVSVNGAIIEPGVPVQTTGQSMRYIQVFVTATEVRAIEVVDSGSVALPAINISYKVMVLRDPASLGNGVAFEATSGRVTAGHGWFDSDYHYLRAVAGGESPFFIVGGQNMDTAGGITKVISPSGAVMYDFYDPNAYTGSLVSVPVQQVQR